MLFPHRSSALAMAAATRQHISSGVSFTPVASRLRYRSLSTRRADSLHRPVLAGRSPSACATPTASSIPREAEELDLPSIVPSSIFGDSAGIIYIVPLEASRQQTNDVR